tara:strand:+ start:4907 stop:6331 length:1425 start_codon:yes stop_codon:yes gene_type:complete
MLKGFQKENRKEVLALINQTVDNTPELQSLVVHFTPQEVLFKEGDSLSYLYLLLDGSVSLTHKKDNNTSFEVLKLAPGHFIGIVAFNTGNNSLTTAMAVEKIKTLRFSQDDFEKYLNQHPSLRSPLQQLMMSNMTERFKINLELESRLHSLNHTLEEEGAELKEAYQKLEDSHQKLVHQEKMATLGELVAGFAHEVNNPASSLLRSSEALITNFKHLSDEEPLAQMFQLGLDACPLSSTDIRTRMVEVQKRFPLVSERSMIRKLAQIPNKGYVIIESARKKIPIETLVQQHEAGKFIHNIQLSSERIANLVKSLKSYSRQDRNEAELVDLRDGIKDTILVLSNRLKYLNLDLDLQEIPKTKVKLGELNQVWTNIIVNACDVLPDGGNLRISSTEEGGHTIKIVISDNGPGIPESLLNRIFEPNFTTKNQGAKFGLGLGLAISNEIVRQNGGLIRASNKKSGGAKFEILLPVKNS